MQEFVISEYGHVHPDHSLEVVIDRLGKSPGLLPVVSRADTQKVVGVITPQTLGAVCAEELGKSLKAMAGRRGARFCLTRSRGLRRRGEGRFWSGRRSRICQRPG